MWKIIRIFIIFSIFAIYNYSYFFSSYSSSGIKRNWDESLVQNQILTNNGTKTFTENEFNPEIDSEDFEEQSNSEINFNEINYSSLIFHNTDKMERFGILYFATVITPLMQMIAEGSMDPNEEMTEELKEAFEVSKPFKEIYQSEINEIIRVLVEEMYFKYYFDRSLMTQDAGERIVIDAFAYVMDPVENEERSNYLMGTLELKPELFDEFFNCKLRENFINKFNLSETISNCIKSLEAEMNKSFFDTLDSNNDLSFDDADNNGELRNLDSEIYGRHKFYNANAYDINHLIQDFFGEDLSIFISKDEIEKAKEHFVFNSISSEDNKFQSDILVEMSSTRKIALANHKGFAKIHVKDQHDHYPIINFAVKVNDSSNKVYGVESVLYYQDLNSCITDLEVIKLEHDMLYPSAHKEGRYIDSEGNRKEINLLIDKKEVVDIFYTYRFDESGVEVSIGCYNYSEGLYKKCNFFWHKRTSAHNRNLCNAAQLKSDKPEIGA